MERTIPRTDSNEIDLYIRTYYSLLRSSGEVAIETLSETHKGMKSLLHPYAHTDRLDISAFAYSLLRLPACLANTRLIIMGQRTLVFERDGYGVTDWQEVAAPARRRRAYFDGIDTLALFIASRSDIDDIIPCLTAYQLEWNKLHHSLRDGDPADLLMQLSDDALLGTSERLVFAQACKTSAEDFERLYSLLGQQPVKALKQIAQTRKRMQVKVLAGSLADYRKAILRWWMAVRHSTPELEFRERRVYFVSSNTHSIVNMWSGHALRLRDGLVDFIEQSDDHSLKSEYEDIASNAVPSSKENFLYYTLKKYEQSHPPSVRALKLKEEHAIGIHRANSARELQVDVQVIELGKVRPEWLDPRLLQDDIEALNLSDALIVNIDYPLGMAAYEILTRVIENVGEIEGVYIMGKAASLNARIGDIMIPYTIHDGHSNNTYLIKNCFDAANVAPYSVYGNVLDNQKCVTVPGTFLQNQDYMSVFYREGYTDIEMEAGPYLSAMYEMIRPQRHPQNEIVSLHGAGFDIGIIHYTSDTPLRPEENLGSSNLSYRGVDPTYAAAVAILRRVIKKEIKWVHKHKADSERILKGEPV